MSIAKISFETKIHKFFINVMVFVIISLFVNLVLTNFFTYKYSQMITNVERANELKEIVEEDITSETWKIVCGMKNHYEGNQYILISQVYTGISYLEENSIMSDNTELEIVRRTTKTLEMYLDRMVMQITAGEKVDEIVATNEEIKSVTLVVSETLEDFSNGEIQSAARLNKIIKTAQYISLALIVLVLIFFAIVMSRTKEELVKEIKIPLKSMETMAGKIATGDFAVRINDTNVIELEPLKESLNMMAIKIEDLIEEISREHDNLKKLEMNLLQAQITPHFLYNTYDTIIWLAEQNKTKEVVEVVGALATFYRISLSSGDNWITIEDEVKHVESYLLIQQYRYGDILDYSVEIGEHLENKLILKLLLQPIVENSIYHGIKYLRGKGKIEIHGKEENGTIIFAIKDTGAGMDIETLEKLRMKMYDETEKEQSSDKAGFGLKNVRKRIKLHYGGSSDIFIESEKGKGTKVIIKLEDAIIAQESIERRKAYNNL